MDGKITLKEITEESLRSILKLVVNKTQEQFVASNAISIAQAYFSKEAWFRGIYLDDQPVGFVMLSEDTKKPEYYLWRFMIDIKHQGNGYGSAAIKEVVKHVKTLPGATEFLTSAVPGEGSPIPFYEKCGFVLTGEKEDGEDVMKLML